jgi:hypothetical protein
MLEQEHSHTMPSSPSSTFQEYFHALPLDIPLGIDPIERMFRSFSSTSYNDLMSSVDKNGGSGGYTEYIFKYAAQHILHLNLWEQELQYKV